MLTKEERKERRALRITSLLWWDIAERDLMEKRFSRYFPLVRYSQSCCILCDYFACKGREQIDHPFPTCPLQSCNTKVKFSLFSHWILRSGCNHDARKWAQKIANTCYHEYKTKYEGVF